MDEYDKDIMAELLEMGIVEIQGYDKLTDQITYNLTEKCRELYPELWEEHFKFINQLAFDMWEKGLIEMNFDGDGTPMVMLKSETVAIKDTLPEEERFFIENLIHKDNTGGII